MNQLTLVIPAKEESDCLPKVIDEIKKKKIKCKILVSLSKKDISTINSIKKYNLNIHYQKNKGYGSAIIEGINKVKTKYFSIFNADGSFNPSELSNQIKKLEQKKLDFIFASRYIKKASSDDDTIITYIGNIFFSFIGRFFFDLPISDILYTFVTGKTKSFKKIKLKEKSFSLCVELPILCKKNNFKIADIASNERLRIAGNKKVNAFKDGFLILITLIKLFINHEKN